jgi:pilus assembly protein CpaB
MASIQDLTLGGGNRTMLIVAIVAGLVAAAVVFIAVSESDSGSSGGSSGSGAVSALVAAESIPIGTTITEDMVRLADVPEDVLVAGALDDSEPAVGEVARVAISSGEQITRSKLGVPVPDKGLAGVVPAGMRAVSIEVDEVTAVGGLLLPGDRVDILAVRKVSENTLRTEIVLQDVEVLSVAQEALEASGRAVVAEDGSTDTSLPSGQLPDDVEEQPNAGTLTLALNPSQLVSLISYHDNEDVENIWAVLRPYGDRSTIDVAPTEMTLIEDNN